MRQLLLITILFLTARCATIANGRFQSVPVTSDPAGASIHVSCGDTPADGGVTPATVRLRRNSPSCSITLAKSGFADQVITFQRMTSGWFWGNMASPGLIGEVAVELSTGPPIFVFEDQKRNDQVNGVGFVVGTGLGMLVDHFTGAQYRLVPSRVDVKLR